MLEFTMVDLEILRQKFSLSRDNLTLLAMGLSGKEQVVDLNFAMRERLIEKARALDARLLAVVTIGGEIIRIYFRSDDTLLFRDIRLTGNPNADLFRDIISHNFRLQDVAIFAA